MSDGTLKGLDGSGTYTLTTIPSGQSVKDFGGGASARSAWAAWAAGGVWDTTHNQFIAGMGNSGFPSFDLNVFDMASGTAHRKH